MKKTMIAVDSAAAFSKEEASELRIAILPLTVIIEKDSFQDAIDVSTETVYESIRQNKSVSTSQVNIGYAEEMLAKWDKEYDEIIIITLPKKLSGTFNCIRLAAEQLGLSKVHVIDCNNLCGVEQSVVRKVVELVRANTPMSVIENEVYLLSSNSVTLIVPETLDQLKKGGRISSGAAMMANLLKIKPILKLVDGGQTIDKYAIAKSDKKVNDIIMSEIASTGIAEKDLMVYLIHAENQKRVEEVEILVKTRYPYSSIKILNLPPVLAAHAGMGCIAIQACQK